MRYLGIDFGLRRVGLAISEGELASPYKIIEIKNLADGVDRIRQEVVDNQVEKIVVGMPEGKTGDAAKKFMDGLKKAGLDVEAADETLSTQHASLLMIEMDIPQKQRRLNDAQAAAEILQNYLDNK